MQEHQQDGQDGHNQQAIIGILFICLLYTSDAADELLCVDLGGRRILQQKKTKDPEYQWTP